MRPNRIKLSVYKDNTIAFLNEEPMFDGEFTLKNIKDTLQKFNSLNYYEYINFHINAINNYVSLSVTKNEIKHTKVDDLSMIIYESLSSRLMKTIFQDLKGGN